jgi:hypothetical protein
MLLVWHAGSFEIQRHAFQAAYQLRLAAWMVIVLTLEREVVYINKQSPRNDSFVDGWTDLQKALAGCCIIKITRR